MKTLSMIAVKAALVLALQASSSFAADISGVKIADTVKLGDAELVLNGAGVRTRAVF